MGNRRLQRVETVIEWQQRVPAEGNDDALRSVERLTLVLAVPVGQISDWATPHTPNSRKHARASSAASTWRRSCD
jgi:hypothetical protein